MNKRQLIVVLGMHRSGTSAITRGLQVMGVELGDKLMPGIEGNNAKGFWEDIDINSLNNEMLKLLKKDWYSLIPIEQHDIEALNKAGYFLSAVELLSRKMADFLNFAFKDPRISKLLPFWKSVFSHCRLDVRYVVAIRNPISVAKSLLKRDKFDMRVSYLLWLGHVITIMSGTEGCKRVFVDYDRLMQSPEHDLYRVAECFGLEIDPIELENYKQEFLDEGLRNTIYQLSDLLLEEDCPRLVYEVYAVLLDLASEKFRIDATTLHNQVSNWAKEFNCLDSQSLLSLVDGMSKEIVERDEKIAERDREIAERDTKIKAIYNSHSWRLTRPLRFFAQLIRDPRVTIARLRG